MNDKKQNTKKRPAKKSTTPTTDSLRKELELAKSDVKRLQHYIGVQSAQYKDDLEAHEKLCSKYRKENDKLKAYIKQLVNRNIFQRIVNKQIPFDYDL